MRFKPFDPDGELEVYHTDMPHWRQKGCTYFVTYRLADSIPAHVLRGWDDDKLQWMRSNGIPVTKWQDGVHRLDHVQRQAFLKHFNREMNRYLDEGRGCCVLRRNECANVVVSSWEHFDGVRYDLGDLIVMPNHVHLLVMPFPDHSLERILQSRKRQSATEINTLLRRTGKLWQKHSYDHIVRSSKELFAFQNYIADNPGKANLREEEFTHRSFDWQSKLAAEGHLD